MSKSKDVKKKSDKKAPEKTLKEKRAAKSVKRLGKNKENPIDLNNILGGKPT
jgi:hypothetical protein